MPAKRQRDNCHQQQRQHLQAYAFSADKDQQQQEGHHQRGEVELVTVRQHQRLRGNFPTQFAKRYNRPGEGDRTDKDAEEHFGQMDIDQNRLQARFVIQIAVKAYQYGRQAHEAVQDRHQFRHFGHFDFLRQMDADGTTNHHSDDNPSHVAGFRPEDGRHQRNRHTGDTVHVALTGRLMFGKPGQAENKQNRGNNVCSCN